MAASVSLLALRPCSRSFLSRRLCCRARQALLPRPPYPTPGARRRLASPRLSAFGQRGEQLRGRRQRLAHYLVHVQVLVAREAADEGHVRQRVAERLVAAIQRSGVVAWDGVVGIALG